MSSVFPSDGSGAQLPDPLSRIARSVRISMREATKAGSDRPPGAASLRKGVTPTQSLLNQIPSAVAEEIPWWGNTEECK